MFVGVTFLFSASFFPFISSITELQDGSIMIGGGYNGALYHATRDKNGNINLGTRIEGFEDSNGYPAYISSITELQDGSIMIGGDGGALYRATRDKNGDINLGTMILPIHIFSITELQVWSIMFGGYNGALYHATIPQHSLDHLKQNLDKVIRSQNAE